MQERIKTPCLNAKEKVPKCPTEAEDDIIQPNRVNAKMASNNLR
jgi:hypothetical protein